MFSLTFFIFLLPLFSSSIGTVVQDLNTDQINGIFIDALIEKYGTKGRLSKDEFATLVNSLAARHRTDGLSHLNISEIAQSDHNHSCNSTQLADCTEYLTQHCLDSESIFNIFSNEDHLNAENLTHAFPSLVFSLQNKDCDDWQKGSLHKDRPSTAEVWGYGLGFVVFINVISNVGACLGPFMKTRIFHELLMFCVALAVGTLAGTGFLVLIPESMGLTGDDSPVPDYVLKTTTVIGGIYFFYLAEQVMTSLTTESNDKRRKTTDAAIPLKDKEKELHESMLGDHGHSHGNNVDPVAWMLICGDSLHKFVDGLSIGAAFTQSILTGLSVSISIICEEFPHELGDIAILLHAGLSMKKALFYNLMAAVVGFAGLIVGIIVGENTNANQWIFALAGGLFIYISLVVLIPEMNTQAKNFKKINAREALKVHIIQNSGLIIGFIFPLLIAQFGNKINF